MIVVVIMINGFEINYQMVLLNGQKQLVAQTMMNIRLFNNDGYIQLDDWSIHIWR